MGLDSRSPMLFRAEELDRDRLIDWLVAFHGACDCAVGQSTSTHDELAATAQQWLSDELLGRTLVALEPNDNLLAICTLGPSGWGGDEAHVHTLLSQGGEPTGAALRRMLRQLLSLPGSHEWRTIRVTVPWAWRDTLFLLGEYVVVRVRKAVGQPTLQTRSDVKAVAGVDRHRPFVRDLFERAMVNAAASQQGIGYDDRLDLADIADKILTKIESEAPCIVIAESPEGPVGHATGQAIRDTPLGGPDQAVLHDIYILPEWEHRGLTKFLSDAFERRMFERGVRWMSSSVQAASPSRRHGILRFLAAQGWVPVTGTWSLEVRELTKAPSREVRR